MPQRKRPDGGRPKPRPPDADAREMHEFEKRMAWVNFEIDLGGIAHSSLKKLRALEQRQEKEPANKKIMLVQNKVRQLHTRRLTDAMKARGLLTNVQYDSLVELDLMKKAFDDAEVLEKIKAGSWRVLLGFHAEKWGWLRKYAESHGINVSGRLVKESDLIAKRVQKELEGGSIRKLPPETEIWLNGPRANGLMESIFELDQAERILLLGQELYDRYIIGLNKVSGFE